MASVYFHIPFCKQACHYCDFHFSTTLKHKDRMLQALQQELLIRKEELQIPVESIYFGGGTPSLFSVDQIEFLIQEVVKNFTTIKNPEITLEANPDDLTPDYLKALSKTKVNRLSIGVQSFFEDDLALMNRAHTAQEALCSIEEAKKYFNSITIDLIYAIPGMNLKKWEQNLQKAMSLEIPHISAYALTVEPNTALERFIKTGKIEPVDESMAEKHYKHLVKTLEKAGYINYEFSNFGKQGYFSKNNMAYWTGKPYLGIGPSAHSFNGDMRMWNIKNNLKYIKSIEQGTHTFTSEILSETDNFNEYLMTGLRTMWGVSFKTVESRFAPKYATHLIDQVLLLTMEGLVSLDGEILTITPKGKFLSDGIISRLFYID